ncbi:ORC ubiquitin ligase 1 [Hyperolius riggenbachi]|uniref:ORC ubiquitin ligase 1 n=1 Tax=Hyperolius riggenbachi TaxID=752182 RepID=UPI0035A31BB9
MAHTAVQNVTLALTLPITCHICLGKVRQPVICGNRHVFCSVCIDLWLRNNNQCPACRVPITSDNPCKNIIGGVSENEDMFSPSIRKHLRKTRLDLLHKEYEDEIDTLLKEAQDLKRTNLELEERMKGFSDPVTNLSSSCNCGNQPAHDNNRADDHQLLRDCNTKLQVMNAEKKKVTEDVQKLKEENTRLKNENIEFVRENLRLKNEVELRSPQKFGRYTVAALQAKVDQYEREMNRLKKALERSDQYIEELEAQILQMKRPSASKQTENLLSETTTPMEEHSRNAATSSVCQNVGAAGLSLNASHDFLSCADNSEVCSSVARLNQIQSKTDNTPQLGNVSSAVWSGMKSKASIHEDNANMEVVTMSQDFNSPSSSLAFSFLQLNTPGSKVSSSSHPNLKKPLTYLRKLVFDDLPKRGDRYRSSSGEEHRLSTANETMQLGLLEPTHQNLNPQTEYSESSGNADMGLQLRKHGLHAGNQSLMNGLQSRCREGLNHLGASADNSDVQLHNDMHEPTDGEKQKRSSHGCVTYVPHGQAKTSSLCNSSSAPDNNEHASLVLGQSSTSICNIGFHNNHLKTLPCVSLQHEEEVKQRHTPVKAVLSGSTSECGRLPSSVPQTHRDSSPAKRKLFNQCSDSPSKSCKK